MVEIKPFKAYRYNKQKIDPQDVIVPPYDVIDRNMRMGLKNRSEFNFVNIILNESHDNAKELLHKWIKENVLIQDREDSIYIYQQEFKLNNKTFKRTGFVCLLKIEELGNNILPHEETFEKHIEDRLSLMEKTYSNLELIFMVYQDKKREIDRIITPITEKTEELKFVDNDNCTHRIYKVSNQDIINNIAALMQNKKLLIADGHHRYKTALRYSKKYGYGYIMAALVNSDNEGMAILPTNRVVEEKIDINDFTKYFNIKPANALSFGNNSFIAATNESKYLMELKQANNMDLDVEILHKLVFGKILKIPQEEQKPPKINFFKGNKATLDAVNESNTAFFVNPPSLDKVYEIASANRLLPQKSTYFYPKMFSGLVINKFEAG
ncbi:MAG: DUF1015 domain-containing protein [Nanoarchaeota archaeon]